MDHLPAYVTLPNGTTHVVWLDDDYVVRVEGETIDRAVAQAEVDRIIADATIWED